TLSHRDWAGVLAATRQRFPELWTPGRSDLCFATTNRQSALMAMAPRCDAVIVIGSANSSNTRALEKLALEAGTDRVYRVNRADGRPGPRSQRRAGRALTHGPKLRPDAQKACGQLRGTSFHADSRSTRTSPGSPRTRSPTMLRMTSEVPPSIELARLRRNAFC